MTSSAITGSTGFIGRALARRLLAAGSRVTGLARDPARAAALAAAGMVVARGDVPRPDSLAAVFEGAEVAYHLAAVTGPAPRRRFDAVNVAGTRAVVEAARRAGVRRLVHVSSQAAVFGGEDLLDVDEDTPYPARFIDPYSRTKAEGERIALAANSNGLEVTVVRPCLVWGPGDTTFLPNFEKLARGFGIPLPGPCDRPEATTYVDNLVDGLVLAGTTPAAAGRVYYVADAFEIGFREFLERQLRAIGVAQPRFRSVPYRVAAPIAWLLDVPTSALGLPVQLARFGLRSAVTGRRVRIDRARRELGYEPKVGLEEGLAAMRSSRVATP